MTEPDEVMELAQVAEFLLECPDCGTPVSVGVLLEWAFDSETGAQGMNLHPDLTEIWAHSFSHQN